MLKLDFVNCAYKYSIPHLALKQAFLQKAGEKQSWSHQFTQTSLTPAIKMYKIYVGTNSNKSLETFYKYFQEDLTTHSGI